FKLTPEEGIRLLAEAGAIPVMAHPGIAKLDGIFDKLVEAGLKGLEVFHPNHDKQLEQRYTGIAKKLGLMMTGGSDYHGPSRKEGIELGAKTVDMAVVLELQKLKS
ncbi:MAG TPA: phosphatase, partial [Verrucomicrobiae bacterium]|nr:phosphatase [Verrucomicrobiae bacterium]